MDERIAQNGRGQIDDVGLELPARGEFLRLARLAGSGLASRLGFSWDEVEDLRLAIDELCFALVGPDDNDDTLRLRFRLQDGRLLEVTGWLGSRAGESRRPQLSDLGERILEALVDDHGVAESPAGTPALWLRKVRALTEG